jgi:hypothetical protein
MPTVSDPDNKGEWLVQCTLANITGDHSPPPAGITYASVPPGQACELREFGIEQVVSAQSPDRLSQLVVFAFEADAFNPGQREHVEEAARSALRRLQHVRVVAQGDVTLGATYRNP